MKENYLDRAERAIERAKKLTTKDRKKMKESTFCGPGRSFPCNDCQHVATAKAFLNRSKFSASTKKKIAACINKKAKALGCNTENKAKAYTEFSYESLTKDQKALYDSDVFEETRNLVEESIKKPDQSLDFTDCTECV